MEWQLQFLGLSLTPYPKKLLEFCAPSLLKHPFIKVCLCGTMPSIEIAACSTHLEFNCA